MRYTQKKILSIMSNGASYKNFFNSIITNQLHYFQKSDYNNLEIYSKNHKITDNLSLNENMQYRKKYLN